MTQKLVLVLLGLLVFCRPAVAGWGWDYYCYGNVWVNSDASDVIEEYSNRVRVYIPLKIQLSSYLAYCADEIWIEAVDSNNIKFSGPTNNKKGKLLDNQFKQIKKRNGIWKTDLDERITQMWVRLQHATLLMAGTYSSRVKVSILSEGWIVAEQYHDIYYYSEPKIAIELDSNSQSKVSGSNGDYQIDLGELVSNARFDWGIKVLSNSAYDIVLDSEYNGLRHDTKPNALIDYTIGFDNVKIQSSEQFVRRYDFSSSVKNTFFGFSFVLGNVDLMPAGNYQDNISLTIYPH